MPFTSSSISWFHSTSILQITCGTTQEIFLSFPLNTKKKKKKVKCFWMCTSLLTLWHGTLSPALTEQQQQKKEKRMTSCHTHVEAEETLPFFLFHPSMIRYYSSCYSIEKLQCWIFLQLSLFRKDILVFFCNSAPHPLPTDKLCIYLYQILIL